VGYASRTQIGRIERTWRGRGRFASANSFTQRDVTERFYSNEFEPAHCRHGRPMMHYRRMTVTGRMPDRAGFSIANRIHRLWPDKCKNTDKQLDMDILFSETSPIGPELYL
jgi:hypothetical protein